MKRATALLSAGVLVLGALVLSGCETGRVNKLHARVDAVSDPTTVPGQNPQFASVDTGNPPVPGSPTAAGSDGMQPLNDNQARESPGTEDAVEIAPRQQPADPFVRQ